MDQKSPEQLQKHMLGTYFTLRVGLTVIGFALPFVLLVTGGLLHDSWFLASISDYYYPGPEPHPFLTTRDFFVGGLFAAAACLYLYKGYSTKENVALNLAGVFAVFVALFPTAAPKGDEAIAALCRTPAPNREDAVASLCRTLAAQNDGGLVSVVHGTSAVLFFLCIAYVSLRRSRDTLDLLPPARRAHYAQRYRWTGRAMVASPLAAVVLSYTFSNTFAPGSWWGTIVFWVETLAVCAFAEYWRLKTLEMRESGAERRVLDAELQRAVVPATLPGEADPTRLDAVPGAAPRKGAAGPRMVERIIPADSPGAP